MRETTESVQCVRRRRGHAPDARLAGTSALRGTQADAPLRDPHGKSPDFKSRHSKRTTGLPVRLRALTPGQPAKAAPRQANHSEPNRSAIGPPAISRRAALSEQNRPPATLMETGPQPAAAPSEQSRPPAAASARDRRQVSHTAISPRSTRLAPASQRGQSLLRLTALPSSARPRRPAKLMIAMRIWVQ